MRLTNKRIFIVEDNAPNRAIMQTILEQHGARVAFERWGRNTVEELKRFAPVDIILLDLMYPNNVTGFDIYDLIRAEPQFAYVPIVAVSAMDASVAVPKTRAKGFAGFIGKPVDFELFPQQVALALEGAPVWNHS